MKSPPLRSGEEGGRRGEDHAEVLSGAAEGDIVVLYPGDSLAAGARAVAR